MLYLFSSNARGLYIQDTLNVLALPEHALYQFRYDEKWLTDELKVEDERKKFINNEGLVVLVVQPKDKTPISEEDVQFFPIRKVYVRDLALEGRVFRVDFEIGPYVDWSKLEAVSDDERNRTIITMLQNGRRPPRKYASVINTSSHLSPYIEFAQPHIYAKAWQSAVDTLSRLPDFSNTVFFQVSGMYEISEGYRSKVTRIFRRSTPPLYNYRSIPLTRVLPNLAGYELKTSTTNLIDLNFYQPSTPREPVQGSSVNFLVDKAYFAHVPRSIDVTFRYEQARVPLLIPALNQDVVTSLAIKLANGSNKASEAGDGLANSNERASDSSDIPVRSAEINLMIRILYPRLKLTLNFTVLFFAQLMTVLAGKSAIFLGFINAPASVVANAEIIDATLAISGPLLTTFMLFVLYRRIPSLSK